jgi:FMN-dependent NADH-azoreductase
MVCITTRGGDYSESSPFHAYDFQESYLRSIFGFVGITDIQFINSQPMDVTPELREAAISKAIEEAKTLAATVNWTFDNNVTGTENPQDLKPHPIKT